MESKKDEKDDQRGMAIIIAMLVMALLMGFVVLALSRTTTETLATANDAAESRAFSAAEASLENMTRDLDKVFEEKLTPVPGDLTKIVDNNKAISGFSNYRFEPEIKELSDPKNPKIVVVSKQQLQGLSALRQEWEVVTTATDLTTGVKVKLRRQFFNDEVPIFQFGIFYDDDLEFHPGPRFDFGGRVHSNRNLYLMASTGLYFSSRVSSVGQIVTDIARNGNPWTDWGENVWVKNGTYKQVKHDMGSALNNPTNGANLFAYDSDMPPVYKNAGWATYKNDYGGNLLAEQPRLDLPLAIDSRQRGNQIDYVELIKRGKNIGDLYNDKTGTATSPRIVAVPASAVDSAVTTKDRYANKAGIRVSLADTKQKLPGCAATTNTTRCGVQLDGLNGGIYGYLPSKMTDNYQATRVNAERLYRGSYTDYLAGKGNWIKIELVSVSSSTNLPVTNDVTEDFLSLGVTEPAPIIKETGGRLDFQITDNDFKVGSTLQKPGDAKYPDNRSVFKLQRFMIPGSQVKATSSYLTAGSNYLWLATTNFNGSPLTTNYNFVIENNGSATNDVVPAEADIPSTDDSSHQVDATVYNGSAAKTMKVVPFPIMMFDTREGLYNDDLNTGTTYPGGQVPLNGVMSMLDIDVANLRRFFKGDFNNLLPTDTDYAKKVKSGVSLKNTDVPNKNGWVLYISDRRGDYDFDGEYDMEDIYGNNDGILQRGEDVNNDGVLQKDYNPLTNSSAEGVKYTASEGKRDPDWAAVINTKYYRRGVRLINGTLIPGNYDAATPANTNGFTVASENGVYVDGNYNATGIRTVGTPTQSTDYLPQDTADHIPASVIGDAITILSNNWEDADSFAFPFSMGNRPAAETTIRFAMLAGDTMSSRDAAPNQGGGDPRLSGGVHNFKRFLENWGGVSLNYDGSLINLYNSHNNNGAFKCCINVYSPPTRNWVFDATFLDPYRLPPGTPFFQSISLTGFQRINN